VKRIFDIAAAAIGLVVLSTLFAAIAALLLIAEGRPVLFVQERVGKDGRPFMLYKFRTMARSQNAVGRALPDDQRLTSIGIWLRALSLDELPELWNVLVGDMSLVGPRPLPVRYLARYTAKERRRHEVRPGITGWAQVNGRNAVGWNERLAMDVWYVDHRSFCIDARILVRTVAIVTRRHGISAEGSETMPELRPHVARASQHEAEDQV
jgi:sugar transferase EpsL